MTSQDAKLHDRSACRGADGVEASQKFWVAVYTRPRSEKKAALELGKAGIETYIALQKQLRLWSDRTKLIETVVIPMIIFAHVNEKDILTIKKHPLVIKVLCYPGRIVPAHIPTHQIDSLKQLMAQTRNPVEFIGGKFSANDKVIVVKGSLKGLVGCVKEAGEDTTTVWIGVDLLGGVTVKLKTSNLAHHE